MHFGVSALSSALLVVGLIAGAVACSSDSDAGDGSGSGSGSGPCLKVRLPATDAGAATTSDCMELPAACKDLDDACGEPGDSCDQALDALCTDGTTRFSCVSTTLNHRTTSVDVGCELR